MSGEVSKENGEYGEKIVQKFLELIGWGNNEHPVTVTCHSPNHKTKGGNQKKDHGLDFLFRYSCPLKSNIQKTIAISAKYYSAYPKDPSSKTKEFIFDLGSTMYCLSKDKTLGQKKIDKFSNRIEFEGLLFYLTQEDASNYSILDKLKSFRKTDKDFYYPIHLIDNSCISFIYSSLKELKSRYNDNYLYSYFTSSQNVGDTVDLTGKIMPVEYINSGILPFQVQDKDGKTLVLYVKSNFSEENFASLVDFSIKYTNSWASKVMIYFPDYKEREHKNIISSVLSTFHKNETEKIISVMNYTYQDFRQLEN